MNWSLPAADSYFAPMLERDPRGFEIDHLDLALRHCECFRCAVDGGAHVGTWTAAMAQRFETVWAFEPAPDTFSCLTSNVAGAGNVNLFRMALGAERGRARIVDDPTRLGNTGSRHLNVEVTDQTDTDVVTLDSFSLADVDFLKLDVEGYELNALKGAKETLRRCRPTVLIEAKKFRPERFGVDAEAASAFLRDLGFRQVAAAKNDRVFTWGS